MDAVENIFEEPTDDVGDDASAVMEEEKNPGIPAILQEIMDEEEAFLKAVGLDGPPGSKNETAEVDAYLDRLLQRIGELEAQEAESRKAAKLRKAMVEAWLVDETMGIGSQRTYLEGQVRAIAETWYPFPKGKKSRSLPHGNFGFRKAPDTVEITDQGLAIPWAEENDVTVKVTKEVQKTPVKKYIAEMGVLPDPEKDGIIFHEGRDQFSLSAKTLEG